MNGNVTPRIKGRQGFASMSPEKQREIARKGGKTGGGHRWTREEAQVAGRKGMERRWQKDISRETVKGE